MILVGDFVPQKTSPNLPDFGDEIILANLEGPLCEDGLKPIDKVGIHLHSSPRKFVGRWAFTLANNHLMDYREEGLRQTIHQLNEQQIPYVGAGASLREARETMWLEDAGKRIAVIGCCEHQFGVADEQHGGVAALGDWVASAIQNVKTTGADFVIVSSHMGSESSKYVSPRQVALYHSFIEAGADVVHGHHAHIPQGWEEYLGKPIFYGLGNYVIDQTCWQQDKNFLWSLLVRIDFSGDNITWRVEKVGTVPEDADSYLEEANAIFKDEGLLEGRWIDNCSTQYGLYYKPFLKFSLKGLLSRVIHPKRSKLVRDCFNRCETHRDIIRTACFKGG